MSESASWWLNQSGIVIEVVGAAYLLWCSYRSKRAVLGARTDLDHIEDSVKAVLNEINGTFRNQLWGFAMLGFGLLLQFVANGQPPTP